MQENKNLNTVMSDNIILSNLGIIDISDNESNSIIPGIILNQDTNKKINDANYLKEFIDEYGADAVRFYILFMGPINKTQVFYEEGLDGAKKFIDRLYHFFEQNKVVLEETLELEELYNKTINEVTINYESFNINIAISKIMIFLKEVYKLGKLNMEYAINLMKLLNPIVPFVTEEIWNTYLNQKNSILMSKWPTYKKCKNKEKFFELVIQVNGKTRGKTIVNRSTSKEEMLEIAKNITNVKLYLDGKIDKVIIVPEKLINIVVK